MQLPQETPFIGSVNDDTVGSTAEEGADGERRIPDVEGRRRLPRTVGVVDDESFRASDSEAYIHEYRDRERISAG